MKFRVERDVLAEAVAWAARSLPARPPVPVLAGLLLERRRRRGWRCPASTTRCPPGWRSPPTSPSPGGRWSAAGCSPTSPAACPRGRWRSRRTAPRWSSTCGSARFTLLTLPVEDYPALPAMPSASGSLRRRRVRRRGRPGGHRRRPRRHPARAHRRARRDRGREDHHGGHRPLPPGRARAGLDPGAARPVGRRAGPGPHPGRHRQVPRRRRARSPSRWRRAAAGEGLVGFEGGGRRTTSRLLDGEFPKYRSLLPGRVRRSRATVETAALIESVRRVALVAERNTPIRLAFATASVTLEAGTRRRGAGLGVARRAARRATTSRSRSTRATSSTGSAPSTPRTPQLCVHRAPPGRRSSPARPRRRRDGGRGLPLPADAGAPVRLSRTAGARRARTASRGQRRPSEEAISMEIGLVGLGRWAATCASGCAGRATPSSATTPTRTSATSRPSRSMVEQLPSPAGRLGDGAGRRDHPADHRAQLGELLERRRRRRRRRQLPLHRRPGPRRARSPSAASAIVDAGVSGGVWGLDNGYALMVGGDAEDVGQGAAGLRRAQARGRVRLRARRPGRCRATSPRWCTTASSTA